MTAIDDRRLIAILRALAEDKPLNTQRDRGRVAVLPVTLRRAADRLEALTARPPGSVAPFGRIRADSDGAC